LEVLMLTGHSRVMGLLRSEASFDKSITLY
jgi:hypothetical protein